MGSNMGNVDASHSSTESLFLNDGFLYLNYRSIIYIFFIYVKYFVCSYYDVIYYVLYIYILLILHYISYGTVYY